MATRKNPPSILKVETADAHFMNYKRGEHDYALCRVRAGIPVQLAIEQAVNLLHVAANLGKLSAGYRDDHFECVDWSVLYLVDMSKALLEAVQVGIEIAEEDVMERAV